MGKRQNKWKKIQRDGWCRIWCSQDIYKEGSDREKIEERWLVHKAQGEMEKMRDESWRNEHEHACSVIDAKVKERKDQEESM